MADISKGVTISDEAKGHIGRFNSINWLRNGKARFALHNGILSSFLAAADQIAINGNLAFFVHKNVFNSSIQGLGKMVVFADAAVYLATGAILVTGIKLSRHLVKRSRKARAQGLTALPPLTPNS